MTKKQIYDKVYEILFERRNQAVMLAEKNRQIANQNKEFEKLEHSQKLLNLEIGRLNFEKKDSTLQKKELADIQKKRAEILKSIGLKEKDLLPQYHCKKCLDSGVFEDKVCSCAKQIANQLIMKNSGVDFDNIPSLKDYDCNFFEGKAEKDIAKKRVEILTNYVKDFDNLTMKNIVMCGEPGTGKTHLALCIAKDLVENGHTTLFLSSFNLGNIFLEEHLSSASAENKLQDILDVDCLVIDDLGTEPIRKNVTMEYLLLVLNERQLKNKATIITTNLNPEQILNRYEERIFSRIFNKRCSLIMKLEGENKRLKRD